MSVSNLEPIYVTEKGLSQCRASITAARTTCSGPGAGAGWDPSDWLQLPGRLAAKVPFVGNHPSHPGHPGHPGPALLGRGWPWRPIRSAPLGPYDGEPSWFGKVRSWLAGESLSCSLRLLLVCIGRWTTFLSGWLGKWSDASNLSRSSSAPTQPVPSSSCSARSVLPASPMFARQVTAAAATSTSGSSRASKRTPTRPCSMAMLMLFKEPFCGVSCAGRWQHDTLQAWGKTRFGLKNIENPNGVALFPRKKGVAPKPPKPTDRSPTLAKPTTLSRWGLAWLQMCSEAKKPPVGWRIGVKLILGYSWYVLGVLDLFELGNLLCSKKHILLEFNLQLTCIWYVLFWDFLNDFSWVAFN